MWDGASPVPLQMWQALAGTARVASDSAESDSLPSDYSVAPACGPVPAGPPTKRCSMFACRRLHAAMPHVAFAPACRRRTLCASSRATAATARACTRHGCALPPRSAARYRSRPTEPAVRRPAWHKAASLVHAFAPPRRLLVAPIAYPEYPAYPAYPAYPNFMRASQVQFVDVDCSRDASTKAFCEKTNIMQYPTLMWYHQVQPWRTPSAPLRS